MGGAVVRTVSWGLVVAALRAMLRWRGGSAGSCTMWWGLGMCWVGVAGRGGSAGSWHVLGRGGDGVGVGGGWALRAALRWRGGSGGVLACRVGSARWVWRGRMEVVRVHEWAAISRVLRRVGAARWVGGGGVAGQDGGGSHAQMGCNLQGFACHVGAAGWWWWRVVSHVGAACWGRDEWKRLVCTRGRQWPATLKVSCGDGPRGITAWW
ncbi:hypothetical protein EDB89DRAFT_1915154 [Lactarius sanguifluus]|nr:hypothetical protein EDB89DRAFT_1915154 [Lactarius sanguifluus]